MHQSFPVTIVDIKIMKCLNFIFKARFSTNAKMLAPHITIRCHRRVPNGALILHGMANVYLPEIISKIQSRYKSNHFRTQVSQRGQAQKIVFIQKQAFS